MTMFICPKCEKEFEDLEGEEQANCDCIREEGECMDCAGYE